MTPHQREKITRYWTAGNDTLQIAEAMNLSEAEVYNALGRMRRALGEAA
jgi:DNA-binding CsgD family transcriptional regulator